MVEGSAVSNATLRAALARSGALMPARAVAVIAQIAAEVDAAAASVAVRSDVIDPANVVLAADDVAYLADMDGAGDEAGTGIEGWAYLAPERLVRNAPVSAATDVYALACVLFECLTGVPPWPPGSDLSEVIAARQAGAVPRPSQHLPSIPVGFDGVIARGLAVDPAQRYANAGELAGAARQALSSPVAAPAYAQPGPVVSAVGAATRAPRAPIPAVVPEAAGAASSRSGKRRRRVRIAVLVTTVTAIVAVAAAAAAVVVIRHQRSSTSTSAAPAPANPWTELSFPGLREPTGLAVDRAGNVYVTETSLVLPGQDGHKNWLWKLPAGATTPTRLGFFADPDIAPAMGRNVATDTVGNLYILGYTVGRDPSFWVWKWAPGADSPTELGGFDVREPASLAADSTGNVYVAATAAELNSGGRVWKLAAGTSTPVELPFPDLNHPGGIAVDAAGTVYVTDWQERPGGDENRVWRLAAGAASPAVVPGLCAQAGVAVDAAGSIYTAATYCHQGVCKLETGADWPGLLVTKATHHVAAVAVDLGGNLYYSDYDYTTHKPSVWKVAPGYTLDTLPIEWGQRQSC